MVKAALSPPRRMSSTAALGTICRPFTRPSLRSISPKRARSRRPVFRPPPAKGVPMESTVK
ncbi:hypothetical protein D3C72_1943400 [compost metagenome]